MDMELGEIRMEQDEARFGKGSLERAARDEEMDELEDYGGDMGIDGIGKEDNDNGSRDKGKSRESGKHRSKEGRKRRREEKEHGNRDGERSKVKEKEERDSDRYDAKDKDRFENSRERRKEERLEFNKNIDYEKERDRDKERSRDKVREKDYDRDKYREKERDLERGKDRGKELDKERERSTDREHDRGRDRGKEKGKEREKDREGERERDLMREYDRGKEREKVHDHARDRDKDRERSKIRERDHEKDVEKELDRERGKEKDHERGKDRDREREKDRDRLKDKEREKDKIKDREKEKIKDREKEKEKGKLEKVRAKEKSREKEIDIRDKERDGRAREGEKDEKVKADGGNSRIARKGEEIQDNEGDLTHNEKSISSTSTSELEERVTKMKEERLKRKPDGASEISSWVNKSRKLEEKRNAEKEKALRLSKALEEQDNILAESEDEEATGHSGNDLAGVKILHGLDKVMEGGAVVLTLKDQSILADGDINEDADMLENVEIGEQKQRDEAYRAAKKRTGLYDDKFSDDMGSRKPILPQYDNEIEDEGVTLDESGRFTGEAEKKLEELRKRIEGGIIKQNYEDLTSSGKSSSDYYTPDEMLQFKKPKKKKSLRKKEKLDLDALEAEAISAGLGAGDLGSRNDLRRQTAKEEQVKADAEMRSNAYQSAIAKAEEASKALRQEQTLTVKSVEDDNLVFGEDFEDLQRSIGQARKLALKKQDETPVSGPEAVALVATTKKEQEDASPTEGEPQENKVIITEMEEFVLGLQFTEDTHKPESEDVFKDEEDIPKSLELETEAEVGGWAEVMETDKTEAAVSEEKEDINPDEINHETAIGKGLSGVLKLLKDRGTLNEGVDLGGRNMDKKKSKLVGIYDNEGQKEIRIERTDEFGRIMTPKEAFRMLSHKFHGKGPGKMKQEKRMKQYQEDLKTKQMKASDTPLLAMEKMREAQARLKTPYLVLSGHVKPGQTSDPRSGFATVEKDHLGSLTPMLGDKKVEHFLGINRRPDAGSMGPPPPKKLKS
ncbi:SART-1 family protein DOT2 [Elaeis guineensis]|uniref:SART-1 family protein DOT2 n=1 Tax=Elaeis guineensis var. tenera TaxID=51953 RepID=A0A6I9RI78_ELAGV|nr:SART-1 family protein DOT2 [Elaeis guineensis]